VDKAVRAVRWAPVDHRSVGRADRVVSASEGRVDRAVLAVAPVVLEADLEAVLAEDASLAAAPVAQVDAADHAPAPAATDVRRLEMPGGAAGSSTATWR
jgi:hypothetical protein